MQVPQKIDVFITGVGGQGVVLASDVLAQVGLDAGFDVKKTDSLGMAQRGGSVVSHVRLADKVFSPLIPEGGADFLLSFERLEAVRSLRFLKQGGVAIVDTAAVQPLSVVNEGYHYPTSDEVRNALLSTAGSLHLVPALEIATGIGNPRAASILCLGFLSAFLDIPQDVWLDQIKKQLPPRLHPVNLAAFAEGLRLARARQ